MCMLHFTAVNKAYLISTALHTRSTFLSVGLECPLLEQSGFKLFNEIRVFLCLSINVSD